MVYHIKIDRLKLVILTATLTISVFRNREVDAMYLNQRGYAE